MLAARAALEPWREELRPLLDGGTTPAPSGGQLLELVRRVLVGLAARAPVLLVIDDLHWADRTSWVLPAPASPVSTTVRALPARARSQERASAAASVARQGSAAAAVVVPAPPGTPP